MITQMLDLPILNWIARNLHSPLLDTLMTAITHFGDKGAIWLLWAAVLLVFPKHRKAGFTMVLALLMGLVVCNLALKPLVGRIRPFDYQLAHFGKEIPLLIPAPTDFSFPSGHTNASFAAATALLLRHRKMGIPAMILAVLIAFSRLYLYVHYPTDVLAAMVLGAGVALAATYLVNKGHALMNNKNPKKTKEL